MRGGLRSRAASVNACGGIDVREGGRHSRAATADAPTLIEKVMLKQFFTWWNGSTYGTSFTLWRRRARLVGKDEQGNRYFEEREPSASDGRKRRWVVYHGVAEGSRVPPDWHGWLHHTFEQPPTEAPLTRRDWEQDHLPNMTGTPLAYRPKGSLEQANPSEGARDAYEAWSPGDA